MFEFNNMTFSNLESFQPALNAAYQNIFENQVISRIWNHDYTLWKPESTEITNRLGWLTIDKKMLDNLPQLEKRVRNILEGGFTHIVLLGMGGSSLAPEVFRNTFGSRKGYPDLTVLDSTDPSSVLKHANTLNPEKTLFLVSTKSGTTVETLSFFKFYYNWLSEKIGGDHPGNHFIGITDPESHLADLAEKYHFRDLFLNDPCIGGRFSALSYFGLIPAALLGVNLNKLLKNSKSLSSSLKSCTQPEENKGTILGVIMGELAKAGKDKITFLISPELRDFGNWVEQLIAESTGKEGKSILPIVQESVGKPEVYGNDRLFIDFRLKGDHSHEHQLMAIKGADHPLISIELHELYDLGGQFFLWEFATAVACYILNINPFDQPNVESSKILARDMVALYRDKGLLPETDSSPLETDRLDHFLKQAHPGDYINIQAYLYPTKENTQLLEVFRCRLRDQTKLAVTIGFGPRFLHSTGQLHKGDRGNGLFIQITARDPVDAAIPDIAGSEGASITFGILKHAQALGDFQALVKAGRRIIHFHLDNQKSDGLNKLLSLIQG